MAENERRVESTLTGMRVWVCVRTVAILRYGVTPRDGAALGGLGAASRAEELA